jgi:asparagine synthase (glutamine-hydrolysing)
VTIRQYWDLQYKPDSGPTAREWEERILNELDEAVRLRMIADVPVGAFLSGGVDSSAVVASMALQSGKPVQTFAIGFGTDTHNELPYARKIAERYRTDHHELVVQPEGVQLLPKLVYHYEEPYADSSALPTYYVAKLGRQFVTVALNGDGGDEAFAGYNWYRVLNRTRWIEPFAPVLSLASHPAALWYRLRRNNLSRKGAIFFEGYQHSPGGRHVPWLAYFSPQEKSWLYHPEFAAQHQRSPVWDFVDRQGGHNPVDRALYTDIKSYLADDLVVKVDIASMACSLEARSPLLDHRFLEFAATIPARLKIDKGGGKAIFKQALRDRIPAELMYRKKQGFSVPLNRWFRGELVDWSRQILLDEATLNRKLFRREGLEQLLRDHQSGRANHGVRIWALIMLEMWFRAFVDQRPAVPA